MIRWFLNSLNETLNLVIGLLIYDLIRIRLRLNR